MKCQMEQRMSGIYKIKGNLNRLRKMLKQTFQNAPTIFFYLIYTKIFRNFGRVKRAVRLHRIDFSTHFNNGQVQATFVCRKIM